MTAPAGPRGSALYVESSGEVPLVWVNVSIRGGSAGDPPGAEGCTRHMAELARRGTASRSRAALDEQLDALGASLEVSTGRDAVTIGGLCLDRNLEALIDIAAEVLAEPAMTEDEHERLLRETAFSLDELRDDDEELASRFFNRHCVPGHPYGRTVLGTDASLAALELPAMRAAWRRQVVPENLVLGFAGAIDEGRAVRLATRLLAGLPDRPPPAPPPVEGPAQPEGRRLLLVDKPDRSQSQILIGNLGPRYGTDDALALLPVETAFGGTFTSRLTQEIRAKRGWSYGAGCGVQNGRGNFWFRIYLAPSAEVTPDALALTMSLFEQVAAGGVTAEELEFAKSYLEGSIPFHLATARQRMRVAVRNRIYEAPEDYLTTLPARLAAITLPRANEAAARWLRPDACAAVVVATAEHMAPRLEPVWDGSIAVEPYDEY